MNQQFVKALRRFDSDFGAEVVGPVNDWIPVPDGKYKVRVEDVELCKAEPSGNLRLLWRLRVDGPAMQNHIVWKARSINSDTLQRVKEDLHVCGLRLNRISALPANLDKLVDVELQITKRTSPGMKQYWVTRTGSSTSPA